MAVLGGLESAHGSFWRILVMGHVATRWGLEHFLTGVPLKDLIEQDFIWPEGWEYRIGQGERSVFLRSGVLPLVGCAGADDRPVCPP